MKYGVIESGNVNLLNINTFESTIEHLMEEKKKVFISYSWNDMKVANEVEEDLSKLQIELIRDVRDLDYKSKISDFMEMIRVADFAILLISKSYLCSKNCMKEVLHLIKERDFERKILPVIVDGTKIYSSEDRIEYTKYWLQEKDALSTLISTIPATAILDEIRELKVIEEVASKINEFVSYISDIKNLTFSELKAGGYKEILSYLGFCNITHLIELLKISNVKNVDEKEILLDEWFENNTPTSDAYSIRASIATFRNNIKKAEFNYIKALELNDKNAYALNNYGYMLLRQKIREDDAKQLFGEAIEIMPNLTIARLNLGCLLSGKFNDHEGAKEQYEIVLSYNPTEEKAYNNLANYYKKQDDTVDNRKKICELYEKALSLNPKYIEAHMSYGSYLSEVIGDHETAVFHYNDMLRIDPNSAQLVDALKGRVEKLRKLDKQK